jgi:hypothetical protein
MVSRIGKRMIVLSIRSHIGHICRTPTASCTCDWDIIVCIVFVFVSPVEQNGRKVFTIIRYIIHYDTNTCYIYQT